MRDAQRRMGRLGLPHQRDDEGIAATADETIVAELKKARQQVAAAKKAYWKASAILRDGCF